MNWLFFINICLVYLFVKILNFLTITAPYAKGNFLFSDCLQNVNRNTTTYVISVILVRGNMLLFQAPAQFTSALRRTCLRPWLLLICFISSKYETNINEQHWLFLKFTLNYIPGFETFKNCLLADFSRLGKCYA